MFCFSCKYIPQSPVKECVDSILQFHPNEKILICDSDSPVKDYYKNLLSDNITFFDAKNQRRPFGALLESYKKYPNEENYILIHDTASLTSSIEEFIKNDSPITSFLYARLLS